MGILSDAVDTAKGAVDKVRDAVDPFKRVTDTLSGGNQSPTSAVADFERVKALNRGASAYSDAVRRGILNTPTGNLIKKVIGD